MLSAGVDEEEDSADLARTHEPHVREKKST